MGKTFWNAGRSMSLGQRIFLYHAITWLILVGLVCSIYLNNQPGVPFARSSLVYFNCTNGDFKTYEVVRSDEGRITAIFDRRNKKMVTGGSYVEDTTNCIIAKIEEKALEKQDQNFFEILSFGSNNEELP